MQTAGEGHRVIERADRCGDLLEREQFAEALDFRMAGGAANSPFFGMVGGDVTLGGLRYSAAAGSTVAVGAGNRLGVEGTIIVAPSVGTANQAINGGELTSGVAGGTLGIQHTGGAGCAIGSAIVDGGGLRPSPRAAPAASCRRERTAIRARRR